MSSCRLRIFFQLTPQGQLIDIIITQHSQKRIFSNDLHLLLMQRELYQLLVAVHLSASFNFSLINLFLLNIMHTSSLADSHHLAIRSSEKTQMRIFSQVNVSSDLKRSVRPILQLSSSEVSFNKHIMICLIDEIESFSQDKRMQNRKKAHQILASKMVIHFFEMINLLKKVQYPSHRLITPIFFVLQQQTQFLEHCQLQFYQMNRLEQLIQQGRLLFTPKAYPKYIDNKLRVFKPSIILKTALAITTLYACTQLFNLIQPSEVIIPYPSDPKPQ